MPYDLTDLYNEFAPDYERTRVPRFRPFLKRLLQYYDTRPGSYVLDAGCGTGLAATMVAPRAGHNGKVLGVDLSVKMLEIAREKAHGYGFDQCEFVVGDISHVNAPDETFDLILCSFALWQAPDVLFSEFYRLLKPNGALLAQNWGSTDDAIEQVYNDVLHSFVSGDDDERIQQVRAARAKHRADWAGIRDAQDYDRVLRGIGYSQVGAQWYENTVHYKSLDEVIDFYDVGGNSRLQLGLMDAPTREQFYTAVRAALQPFVTERGVDQLWRVIQISARK